MSAPRPNPADLDVQQVVRVLQQTLGVSVTCGQVVLNLNEGRLQSYEVKIHQRIPSVTNCRVVDKPDPTRA